MKIKELRESFEQTVSHNDMNESHSEVVLLNDESDAQMDEISTLESTIEAFRADYELMKSGFGEAEFALATDVELKLRQVHVAEMNLLKKRTDVK